MLRMGRTGLWLVAVAAIVAAVVGGCGRSSSPDPDPTRAAPASPSASAAASAGAPTGGPPPGGSGPAPGTAGPPPSPGGEPLWTSGPVTVDRVATGPSIPRVIGVRTGSHPDKGYDRIVFDIEGELPGYTIGYVDEVRQDGSGHLVEVPGRRSLLVTFYLAHAHNDHGEALISQPERRLDYPMMRGYVLVSDFEGYVSVAVGLDDVVGFRVGELPGDPGRIYVDVAA